MKTLWLNQSLCSPPVNACGGAPDEDSGDEDQMDINNLQASQMQSQVELNSKVTEDEWSFEDEVPLAEIRKRNKNKSNNQNKSCNNSGSNLKNKTIYRYVRENLHCMRQIFCKLAKVLQIISSILLMMIFCTKL